MKRRITLSFSWRPEPDCLGPEADCLLAHRIYKCEDILLSFMFRYPANNAFLMLYLVHRACNGYVAYNLEKSWLFLKLPLFTWCKITDCHIHNPTNSVPDKMSDILPVITNKTNDYSTDSLFVFRCSFFFAIHRWFCRLYPAIFWRFVMLFEVMTEVAMREFRWEINKHMMYLIEFIFYINIVFI